LEGIGKRWSACRERWRGGRKGEDQKRKRKEAEKRAAYSRGVEIGKNMKEVPQIVPVQEGPGCLLSPSGGPIWERKEEREVEEGGEGKIRTGRGL